MQSHPQWTSKDSSVLVSRAHAHGDSNDKYIHRYLHTHTLGIKRTCISHVPQESGAPWNNTKRTRQTFKRRWHHVDNLDANEPRPITCTPSHHSGDNILSRAKRISGEIGGGTALPFSDPSQQSVTEQGNTQFITSVLLFSLSVFLLIPLTLSRPRLTSFFAVASFTLFYSTSWLSAVWWKWHHPHARNLQDCELNSIEMHRNEWPRIYIEGDLVFERKLILTTTG